MACRFSRIWKYVVNISPLMTTFFLLSRTGIPDSSSIDFQPGSGGFQLPRLLRSSRHVKPSAPVQTDDGSLSWMGLQEQRRQLVARNCRRDVQTLEDVLSIPNFGFLDVTLVDEEHKVMYCAVPKVATTNWKRIFLVLTGLAEPSLEDLKLLNPHDMSQFKTLRDYSIEERLEMVQNYKKFMFVRHPFNRIDSAFYDRLHYDPSIKDNFKRLVGTLIIRRYRPKNQTSMQSLRKGDDVKFHELIQYLTDHKNPNRLNNIHFAPAYKLCHPCQMNYTYIGKYETLMEDAANILNSIDGGLGITFPPSTNTKSKTSKRWIEDMKLLTRKQKRDFYREFKRDFDLFGYSPDEWNKTEAT